MKTTLETSEDENYTLKGWKWKLHSKRVKMKTTLEMSEVLTGLGDLSIIKMSQKYSAPIEPNNNDITSIAAKVKLHSKWVKKENYTRNEWKQKTTLETGENRKLHSERVKTKEKYTRNEWKKKSTLETSKVSEQMNNM